MSNDTFTLSQKLILVDAFLGCSVMRNSASRDAVVGALSEDIQNSIQRSSSSNIDVNNIVSACLNYKGGLAQLIKAVEFFEGNSIAYRQLNFTLANIANIKEESNMPDIATVAAAIGAASSAVGLIDQIADQVERFLTRRPAPEKPHEPSYKIEKEGDALVSSYNGQEDQRITASDLQKLPDSSLKHIKALEQSMENHYAVWASVYPQLALAVDPIAKARTEQQLKGIITNMKGDFEGILNFLEQIGFHLDDHYMHIRDVVRNA